MKKILLILVLLLLTACSGDEAARDGFTIHAFKVGKADSLLLSYQGQHILIDAGEEDDGQKIVRYLQAHDIQKLEALIITHYDKDHVGGADYIVNALSIEHVYVPNYESDSKQTAQFFQAMAQKNYVPEVVTIVTKLSIGDVHGEMYPASKNMKGDNDQSIVTSLRYDNTSFLLAGDIEAARIQELLAETTLNMTHTFLKVPHHGRFNEQTTTLMEAVKPQYALITSSDKHPEHDETVAALQTVGAQIFTTRKGDVTIHSDGAQITVSE